MAQVDSLSNEFEKVKAPTLPRSQQEVATQAFESSVSPLRDEFKERLKTNVESLAKRGVEFGGVGRQSLSDIFKEQQRVEGRIASDIGSRLGQSALDQAFRSSEAAKSRTLQKDLQEAGFQFEGTQQTERLELTERQAQLGRSFQEEQAQLGREFTSEERKRQQDFGLTTQEISQDFQREQQLFNRTFTSEESDKQRQFQTALVDKEIAFKSTQADLTRQEAKNNTAIELALRGNLTGEDVDELFRQTFGEDVVFTNQDEKDMQNIAAASGLSVDDYVSMRQAIGQGQLRDVIENPDDYVESPQKSRDFQMEIAKLINESKKEIADIESEGKVLCTELFRQGRLPYQILKEDIGYSKRIHPSVVKGYHFWGKPLASMMRKSKAITFLLEPFIKSWAYHMAYKTGYIEKRNIMGQVLEFIGIPLCFLIGCAILNRKVYNNG